MRNSHSSVSVENMIEMIMIKGRLLQIILGHRRETNLFSYCLCGRLHDITWINIIPCISEILFLYFENNIYKNVNCEKLCVNGHDCLWEYYWPGKLLVKWNESTSLQNKFLKCIDWSIGDQYIGGMVYNGVFDLKWPHRP